MAEKSKAIKIDDMANAEKIREKYFEVKNLLPIRKITGKSQGKLTKKDLKRYL